MAFTADKIFCEIKNLPKLGMFLRLPSSKDYFVAVVKCLDDERDLYLNQITISLKFGVKSLYEKLWREISYNFFACFV